MTKAVDFEPAIARLLEEMRRKLALPRNEVKTMPPPAELFELLQGEVAELNRACDDWYIMAGPQELAALLAECADVANFAMMIWHAARQETGDSGLLP